MENSILLRTVGKNIVIQRLIKDISQKDLAKLCEKHPGMLSNIENGNSNITIHTLYDIAKALRINIHELFNKIEVSEQV